MDGNRYPPPQVGWDSRFRTCYNKEMKPRERRQCFGVRVGTQSGMPWLIGVCHLEAGGGVTRNGTSLGLTWGDLGLENVPGVLRFIQGNRRNKWSHLVLSKSRFRAIHPGSCFFSSVGQSSVLLSCPIVCLFTLSITSNLSYFNTWVL